MEEVWLIYFACAIRFSHFYFVCYILGWLRGFPCLVSCPCTGAIFWRFVQSVSKSIFCRSGFSFGSVSAALCYRCLDFLRAQSPPADLFFATDFPLSFRFTLPLEFCVRKLTGTRSCQPGPLVLRFSLPQQEHVADPSLGPICFLISANRSPANRSIFSPA
jgi:hypothetical protein